MACRREDADFTERSLIDAKSTADAVSDDTNNFIPVIIECDVKVTTLDGKEIERMKLVNEPREKTFALDLLEKLLS